jgi:hypothetical protein
MIAWMIVVMALSGFSDVGGGATLPPATLGQGVTITPVAGWESAKSVWDVGQGAVSLRRAGVLAAFAADSYSGTTQQLLDGQLNDLRSQFGSFRSLPAASATVAGDIPALTVLFSGTSASSSALEGELVTASTGRVGVVMLAVAPAGQLARVQADLDEMLRTMVVPR